MSLQVKVITPEKVIWSDTSDQVVLPAVTGDLGILKDHAPLVTVLDAGVVRKKTADLITLKNRVEFTITYFQSSKNADKMNK